MTFERYEGDKNTLSEQSFPSSCPGKLFGFGMKND